MVEKPVPLAESIQQLNESVEDLAKRARANRGDIDRQNRNFRWLVISVVLDIFLSVMLGLGGNWLYNIQHQQQQDTTVNRDSQCAFSDLLIKFEKNSVNSPALSPEEKQTRIDSYKVIHQIHDSLKCPPAPQG